MRGPGSTGQVLGSGTDVMGDAPGLLIAKEEWDFFPTRRGRRTRQIKGLPSSYGGTGLGRHLRAVGAST